MGAGVLDRRSCGYDPEHSSVPESWRYPLRALPHGFRKPTPSNNAATTKKSIRIVGKDMASQTEMMSVYTKRLSILVDQHFTTS
jgi:hypothetical protein